MIHGYRKPSSHICVRMHAQLCLTLCNSMDCNPPDSSVRGISQSRILEWVVISPSRGSSRPRDRTCISCVSCIGRWLLYHHATREALSICVPPISWLTSILRTASRSKNVVKAPVITSACRQEKGARGKCCIIQINKQLLRSCPGSPPQ